MKRRVEEFESVITLSLLGLLTALGLTHVFYSEKVLYGIGICISCLVSALAFVYPMIKKKREGGH